MTIETLLVILGRPLLGGLIGYVTNDIAIRMLFRPHRAKYIFGIRIPFTPGIIPKEKGRIAAAIGNAISENLMNHEVVEAQLLSPQMVERVRVAVVDTYDTYSHSTESLRSLVERNISRPQLDTIHADIKAEMLDMLSNLMVNAPVGREIANAITTHTVERIRNSAGGLGGIIGADRTAKAVASVINPLVAKSIDSILRTSAPGMASRLIDTQFEMFLDTPLDTLLANKRDKALKMADTAASLYTSIVSSKLPAILSAVNISKIVEDRINQMDVAETEKLIRSVMNRELRALVWLGALLGFLMGCINLLY